MITDASLIFRSLLAGDLEVARVSRPVIWQPVRSRVRRPGPLETCHLSLARWRRAFSLIEVIIAVAVFAVAVVVILSLLPSLSRSAADSADALVAQSLPDSLRVELMRLANSGGFDALADRLPEMSAPLVDGLDFVAARDAGRVHSVDYLPPPAAGQVPEAARYFRVEAWRFNQPPLRYDPASALLAVYVRVSWPYQNPGAATATPLSARSQLTFTVSLNR